MIFSVPADLQEPLSLSWTVAYLRRAQIVSEGREDQVQRNFFLLDEKINIEMRIDIVSR